MARTSEELSRDAQSQGIALETTARIVLVEAVEVHGQERRQVRATELTAGGVSLVFVGVERIGAFVFLELPAVPAGRSDLEQQLLIGAERDELADPPVQRDVLARREIEVVLLAVIF